MGYYVKIKDLLDNQEVIVGKTEEWNASLEGQGVLVNMYVGMKDAFKGKSADAAREYLSEVHSVVISSYIQMLNEVRVRVLDYVSGYTTNIESSETGKIRQESLEGELESIRSEETEFGCIDERIKTTIASVSHIVSISYPNGENIRDNYYNMQTLLSKLNEDILAYEESHVYDLERVKYILEQININVNSHKELKIDQESQKKLFVAQIDSQYYIQQCAEITGEQYGAFCYVREVERRKEEGVKGMFTGAFAIVIGVTAIVVTFGASAPVVAPAVALALGSTASIYGGSELYTGLETATYGYTGDAETVIYNPVRDTCFKGYEDWYYGIGELSVLGCSAIVMGGGAVSASAKYGTSVWYEAGKETTAIIAGAGADYLTRQGVSKLTDDPLTIYGTGVIVGGIAAGGTDAIGNRLRPNFVATKPNEVGLVGNNGSVTEIPKQDTASIVNPAKNTVTGGGESTNSAAQSISKTPEIKVEFNYNPKFDETEFARQLAEQEKGMNELTVSEYLRNRERYIEEGRSIEGNLAQQVAREKVFVDKVDELQDMGMALKEAEVEAQKWIDTQAALHNPDQIAGGNPLKVDGVGDKNINSSLGSQWKYRIDSVDEQVRSFATTMTEEERNSTYLNVKLIYGGQ